MTTETSPRIDITKVISVYSGKNGHCCCGCSGKHYYALKHVAAASKGRGYEVTPNEVSDRMVKKVVNIINGILDGTNTDGKIEMVGDVTSVVVGERLYIAYY